MDVTFPTPATSPTPALNVHADPVALTLELVNIPSPSRQENAIATAVHTTLQRTIAAFTGPGAGHTTVERVGNAVVARTERALPRRIILAGHLDTVPVAENVPGDVIKKKNAHGVTETRMYGCGTSDMKAGDAVFMHLFAELADAAELAHDVTLVLYDCEEIEASANGLGVLQRTRPELLAGDVAILGEPTDGLIEAGCQGTLRLRLHARGVRAHSARSWLGDNALHRLAPIYGALASYRPRTVSIDGCEYREGLQAVRTSAGVAGNTVPDAAWLDINFRFAPDRTIDQALQHTVDTLGLDPHLRIDATCEPPTEPALYWALTDSAPGALPGLADPAAAALVAAAGGQVRAKYGWTDVSRFAAAGVAAVNLGPGDPTMAHKRDEFCRVDEITRVTDFLRSYLTGAAATAAETRDGKRPTDN